MTIFYSNLQAQNIYSKAYGDSINPAIIFIHGGPSGNSNLFEATTIQPLVKNELYDRRGEGRSKDENAQMTYEESFQDLLAIYSLYDIDKAHLIGHSFGGIIATLFTGKYSSKVESLTLAAALVNQQKTYDHILSEAKKTKVDSMILEVNRINKLSKNSAEYRKSTYNLASEMNFFSMPQSTIESEKLRNLYQESEFYKSTFRNHQSPIKFYQNEKNNNLDNSKVLINIKKQNVPIFAIYGKNDGIFSVKQLNEIKRIVGNNNFELLENCSHYLFVDQQKEFIDFLVNKLK